MTTEEALDAIRDHDPVGSEVLGAMDKGKTLIFSLTCSVPQVLDNPVSRICDDITGHAEVLSTLPSTLSQI